MIGPILPGCMAGVLTLSTVFLLMGLAESLCFTDGIPESQRVNLKSGDGESYPVGIWTPTWAAGVATSAVMQVLVNEKLGFLSVSGGGSATVNGFFAIAGCETPNDIADRRCGRKKTYYHVHLEGWTEGYPGTWKQIQDDYPDTAPENLGSMGYKGFSGQYISREVIETAYAQEGLTLEFYRSLNASWTNPSRYFDNISAFNTENIKFCNETRLMESEAMEQYARVTGDWDGIDNSSGTVVGKCFQGHYWFAPVCRANPMTCYPLITAGPGYSYEHQMQKSAFYNIPLVMVVAKFWSDYTNLPTQVKSSFYWWQPDPTFLSLDARKIIYPEYDASQHNAGIFTTDYAAVGIDKYASADLKALAPEVYEVLSEFNMDLKAVNKLMADQADTGDAPEVVACRWLQANKDLWESWLPDKTECFPHFGLYNELTEKFVEDRSDPTRLTCRICTSGFYSSRLKDDAGVTHVCKPCAAGSAQPSGAALECEPCQMGEFQDKNGSTSCKRCGQGKYQDTKGQSQCKECPAATTTLGLGSASVLECGCEAGRINIANEIELPECTHCGEGLSCPFSSSLETLKLGVAPLGEQYQPALQRGFYCTMDSPLVVFKCAEDSFCPGGVPEVCSGGREGMICAECPTGMTWTGSECKACDPSVIFLWWLCVASFFCALIGGYYILNPKVHALATARQTFGVSVGLAIMWLLTVAIIGTMTVEWPSSVSGSLSVMQFMLLDVDSLSFSCIASEQASARYISKVLAFPTGMAWMCACFFISKCLPKLLQWQPAKTANAIGHYMQASFAIMTTVALQSMTCYVHPNGSYSLVKYSSITCGEGEQATMMAAGVSLLIVFVIGFFAVITYATVGLPSWSLNRTLHQRVQSFNFLTARFRLDTWWFGVPLLLRGPLMSLVVTCATNFPAAQVCLNSLILTIYIVIQAMARPWKVPLLNWVDVCISVLLIQIAMQSGIGVSSEGFSDVFGGIVLVMLFGIIGLMLLAVGFVFLQELCAEKDAKDSVILSMFESRSTGLAKRLLAVAEGVAGNEEAILQSVLEKMNYHDLSRLENSIDLISFELMLGGGCTANRRIHSQAIAARASMAGQNQDMVAAQPPQVGAADPADPPDPADPNKDRQATLTPEVTANPSPVEPVEPAAPVTNEEVTVTTVTPPLPSSQEVPEDSRIVSNAL